MWMGILAAGWRIYLVYHDSAVNYADTEEALKSVPDSFRGGKFWPGRRKNFRTVFRIVLPSAVPGILAGIILAVGGLW